MVMMQQKFVIQHRTFAFITNRKMQMSLIEDDETNDVELFVALSRFLVNDSYTLTTE